MPPLSRRPPPNENPRSAPAAVQCQLLAIAHLNHHSSTVTKTNNATTWLPLHTYALLPGHTHGLRYDLNDTRFPPRSVRRQLRMRPAYEAGATGVSVGRTLSGGLRELQHFVAHRRMQDYCRVHNTIRYYFFLLCVLCVYKIN